jgi:hypothetical protein
MGDAVIIVTTGMGHMNAAVKTDMLLVEIRLLVMTKMNVPKLMADVIRNVTIKTVPLHAAALMVLRY